LLYGTTTLFLEKLGLDRLDDLPPLAEFVPGPEIMDALENSLRADRSSKAEEVPRTQGSTTRTKPRGMPPTAPEPGHQGERLQKVLARAGVASRRASEELISAGRVSVNGHTARLGQRVDSEQDQVSVDGVPIAIRAGLVYYLLNKPRGVVSTASDPQGRPTVTGLVPAEPRVYPVGRLDAESEGLLLLTNDGELTHRLTHPSFGVEKEYLVSVTGRPSGGAIRALRNGVQLDDGMTAPARVSQVEPSMLRITIHEGRKRQVRRMCEAVGHPVDRLVRTRIGPLRDRSLSPGKWRRLTAPEVRKLEREAFGRPAERSRRSRRPA
jgi:23S rRNA pseudouridine2605 synthase